MNMQVIGRVDPRSKILLLLSISVILVGGVGGDKYAQFAYMALAILPMIVLIIEGHFKLGLMMATLFLFFTWVALCVAPSLEGNSKISVMGMVVFSTRILPAAAAGACLLVTTSVSELVCALYKFKLPSSFVAVLVIVFRFFPCVLAEVVAIERSVRMRGLLFGGGSVKTAVFCRLLPFLSNTLRIGDELSAAAIARGLGAESQRSSYFPIRFTWIDFPLLAVIAANLLLASTSTWSQL